MVVPTIGVDWAVEITEHRGTDAIRGGCCCETHIFSGKTTKVGDSVQIVTDVLGTVETGSAGGGWNSECACPSWLDMSLIFLPAFFCAFLRS